jgi:hypothetical protein
MNPPMQTGDEGGLARRGLADGQAKMRLGDKTGAIADLRKSAGDQSGLRCASESLQRLGAVQ